MKLKIMLFMGLTYCAQYALMAQDQKENVPPKKELKLKLNESGSQYVKMTFLNQVWIRFNENNPGTGSFGKKQNESFDIGLRRTRMQLFGQLNDRVFFYTQFGQNNLTFNSPRKQGLFFLDAIAEFKVIGRNLSIGTGLTGWSGLSRYASPSIGSILSLDAPLYQQATNDISDQFIRKYSIYAKGKIGKLDYRLAISEPMSIQNSTVQTTTISSQSLFSPQQANLNFQGYFMYQFLDEESNLSPYNVGSYLGNKSVFNIGLGFILQKDAMWRLNEQADTVNSSLQLLAVDVFYDKPINAEKRTAITVYASFSSNDYGKNYIRNIAVMNPAKEQKGQLSLNGPGNGFIAIGTGNTLYAQVGYLFRHDLFKDLGTIQPYLALQHSKFQLLDEAMNMAEIGLNWIIEDHSSKLSLNYQSRPVFELSNSKYLESGRKGMFVIQYQIAI